MSIPSLTVGGAAVSELTLLMFRVNNLMLSWGDRLVAEGGLTSARWQILGAIAATDKPQPVAWLARDLGSNRQNVQRIVNDLERLGLVTFRPNPHHKRAQLVELTTKGRDAFDEALRLYNPEANSMAAGLSAEDLKAAEEVLSTLKIWLKERAADEK